MRKKYSSIFLIFILLFLSGCQSTNTNVNDPEGVVTISVAKPKHLAGFDQIVDEFENLHPDIRVNIIEMPKSLSERHSVYISALSGKDSYIDIYWMEDFWMNEFIDCGYLLNLNSYMKFDTNQYMEKAVDKFSQTGQMYALPFALDVGFLYYRKDLIHEIPKTWNDVFSYIKNRNSSNMEGIALEDSPSEEMFFNIMELKDAFGGDMKKSLLTYKNMLELDKKQSRGDYLLTFKTGNALFMRNWNYALSNLNDEVSNVRGNVGVTLLPGDGNNRTSSLLGGYGLSVNSYSKHIPQSIEFLKYLQTETVQRNLARIYGYMPVTSALYKDEMVLDSNPHFVGLLDVIPKLQDRNSFVNIHDSVTVLDKFMQNKMDINEACDKLNKNNANTDDKKIQVNGEKQ